MDLAEILPAYSMKPVFYRVHRIGYGILNRAGGPGLNSATESGGPCLASETWVFEQRPRPRNKLKKPSKTACQAPKPPNPMIPKENKPGR